MDSKTKDGALTASNIESAINRVIEKVKNTPVTPDLMTTNKAYMRKRLGEIDNPRKDLLEIVNNPNIPDSQVFHIWPTFAEPVE